MGAATSQISYTASKGGVLALSRELGVEFARQGVRVNALCPGPVNTPLLQELFAADPAAAARRLVHVPMGRFAEVREIADAALFLASDESSYVTAQAFLVDGGISSAYVTPEGELAAERRRERQRQRGGHDAQPRGGHSGPGVLQRERRRTVGAQPRGGDPRDRRDRDPPQVAGRRGREPRGGALDEAQAATATSIQPVATR